MPALSPNLLNLAQSVADVAADDQQLVNWGVVLTNVSGLLIGSSILCGVGGVGYLAFTLPQAQSQILRNQETAKAELLRIGSRLDTLERNDERQDGDLIRLHYGK